MMILGEKGEKIVFRLENLGNTCNLNSSIQCLGRVTELKDAFKKYTNKNQDPMI